MRRAVRKVQAAHHRRQADRIAELLDHSYEHHRWDLDGRDALYVRRYRHLARLESLR